MNRKIFFIPIMLFLIMSLAACASGSGGPGPRTWIDAPLDGSSVALGPIIVRSHAASEGGTAQAVLMVNGVQVRVDQSADSSSPLIEFAQTWIPTAPGEYTLQVISTDNVGNEGRSNSVRVQVGQLPVQTFTPTPLVTTSPIPNITPSNTPESEPTLTLSQNGNCREGDSTAYEVVTAFLAGQQVAIEGRNSDNTWFWVLIPGGGHCWIAGTVGIPTGPYTSTGIVNPPALPAPTVVSPTPPVQAAPGAPGQFGVSTKSCTSSEYIVRLQWNDSNGENGYQIYRDGNLIATIAANSTIFDDNSPDYNSHSYQVQAYNNAGSASSSIQNSEGCLY
ncbi:MAG TPA: hypothetical protein VFI68_08210 [Anaerolineales bacterium]|nr:hypothetical protein [Anaerolineales bacterium]